MENSLGLAVRTGGTAGSVVPTIEHGIIIAILLPNANDMDKVIERAFALFAD